MEFFIINIVFILILTILTGSMGQLFFGFILTVLLYSIIRNFTYKQIQYFNYYLVIVFCIFLILLFCDKKGYGNYYYHGGSDDVTFENAAYSLINNSIFSIFQSSPYITGYLDAKGFVLFLSYIIRISIFFGGYSAIIFKSINLYFSIILVGFMEIIASGSKNSLKLSPMIPFITLLISNYYFVASYTFRDTLNSLFLFLTYFIIKNKNIDKNIYTMLILLIIGFIIYSIRPISIIFYIIIIISFLFINKKTSISYFFFFILALAIIFRLELTNILIYEDIYTSYRIESSVGISNTIFSLPFFPVGIFARFAFALISPFNFISSFSNFYKDLPVLFLSLVPISQFFMLPFFVYDLFHNRSIESIIALLFLLSISFTTFTFRHFIIFNPFFILATFSGFNLASKKMRRKLIYFSFFFLIFIGSIYLIIR